MRANTTCDYAKEVAYFTIKLKKGNPSGSLACVGKKQSGFIEAVHQRY